MKISYNWLQDFITTDLSTDKISEILTDIGLEVEGTEKIGISKDDLENFVVGTVLTCEKHPNADKLKLTTVDLGNNEIAQIVCGAPNVAAGQNVPVAKIGAVIKDNAGNEFKIKKAKLRGEASHGMICSKKELRLSEDHEGIWVMDDSLEPGTPLADIIPTYEDTVYEIGLTPNRADAMGHFGVARDLNAALKARNLSTALKEVEFNAIEDIKDGSPIQVDVQDVEKCPRYAGISMKNIKVQASPDWLQKRLIAIGLSPINNVVDVTNYVLHALGQPMHAFDVDKIVGNKIVVKSGEFKDDKFTTLDKEERKLRGDELMICDEKQPIAIAGVMGGLNSSVTEETTHIFLESAYFHPVSVRKTSKHHAINTTSSFRFERGVDPNATIDALQMAVALLQDIADGEIDGAMIDHYPTPIENHKAILQYRNIDRLIGERLHRDKIKEILTLLEIEIISEINNVLELEIPAYRVDVLREADLIEEILRIYGYNRIATPEKLSVSLVPGDGYKEEMVDHVLAETLVANGFHEAMNLSMYKNEYNQWLSFDEDKSVAIINSLSADLSVMRRSLLPGLLQNIDYNIKRKQGDIKLFEFGNSYTKTEEGFKETRTLGLVLAGKWHDEHWRFPQENVEVAHMKGIVSQLFKRFKLNNIQIEEGENAYDFNGIDYLIDGDKIAHIGKIKEDVCKKFDVAEDVYYAEILMTPFKEKFFGQDKLQFKSLSKFPSVRRDLALLLAKEITYQEVEKVVLDTNKDYIKNVNLFDVYEGDKLPDNKKSYAISVSLQDTQKTMNDKQIDKIMKQVISSLEKKLNAELRN